MIKKCLSFELQLWNKFPLIVGVDEAGRGALAGPIVAALVMLPSGFQHPDIQDSKILTPLQRQKAYQIIIQYAIDYKIVIVSVSDIEIKNPSLSTKLGVLEILKELKTKPDLCLIDGKDKWQIENIPSLSVVGGDRQAINIAAASIIAKVTRDNIMQKLHLKHPLYHWYSNKGYADKKHLTAIFDYGYCGLHRKNYDPIKSLLKGTDPTTLRKKYAV